MRVQMIPGKESIGQPSGISRVVESYFKFGPAHGIEFVDSNPDITVAHAGMTGGDCDVCVLHGLYFTGDYQATQSEYHINSMIADAVRQAKAITVPSNWVAEIIKRDLHVVPFVVPHGIENEKWLNPHEPNGYVLYNKNRDGVDVCNSVHIDTLAHNNSDIKFVSTQSRDHPSNMTVTGVLPFDQMKVAIQKCSVYASLTKETFGIGTLEALASGRPVLGWRYGGNVDLVEHGVNGYLAEPGDYDDLTKGLRYCLKYWGILSQNAVLSSSKWKWDNSLEALRSAFQYAYDVKKSRPSVSVIIPCYNYSHKVGYAVDSALNQTKPPDEVIVVDDGSTDWTPELEDELTRKSHSVVIVHKNNGGVATARNTGWGFSTSKYVSFLDADDRIEPTFLEKCVDALEKDNSLYIAYTKIKAVMSNGSETVSQWPDEFDADAQVSGRNQVPTCCVMRREVYGRLGGQRQRFAPLGAGSEDADLWTRATIFGMRSALVTDEPLFKYSVGTGLTSKPGYSEVDWTYWQPYTRNGIHPFASFAKPKKRWHDVYQYDEPVVSVIIPVGDYHIDKIVDAIDSVEAQTYKKWELIVVLDTDKKVNLSGFPFVRVYSTDKPGSGPGVARNIGVKESRGHFIVFLDADDFIDPSFIETVLRRWGTEEAIIYTDYIGISKIEPEDLGKIESKVLSYDARTKIANVLHLSTPYDCNRAQAQPQHPVYHWCIVTCLIPKAWHTAINGFDESMESWEDVDYHWRMARAGYCYFRVPEPLVYYRFATGQRREHASAMSAGATATKLLNYMSEKYKEIKNMPCQGGCGGSKNSSAGEELSAALQRVQDQRVVSQEKGVARMSDENFKMILYKHGNRGDHPVVGPATGISYGYRAGGDQFLVHVNDIALSPHLFVVADSVVVPPKQEVAETPAPVMVASTKTLAPSNVALIEDSTKSDAPSAIIPNRVYGTDVETLPGISPMVAQSMRDRGLSTFKDVNEATDQTLLQVDGIGPARLKAIRKYLKEREGE